MSAKYMESIAIDCAFWESKMDFNPGSNVILYHVFNQHSTRFKRNTEILKA